MSRQTPPSSVADYVSRRQLLSVTDIVRPAWCEYEFQYGVLSLSHLPLARRPSEINTPEGNTIVPSYVELQQREKVFQAGTGVHTAIERFVHPDQVELTPVTMEDRWALRFIECASGVTHAVKGRAREIPVFGMLNGHPVHGIIDELRRDGDMLVLAETKTRGTQSLPSTEDQRQARIQCMIYRRLYQGLWEASKQLDFGGFAHAIGLRPERELSEPFTAELAANPSVMPWRTTPTHPTLQDMAALAQDALRTSALPISRAMELVYVRRKRECDSSMCEPTEVGRVRFDADDTLDAHLNHVFPLLYGTRLPRGVPEALASRCNRCAWRDGCEWRAKQAAAASNDAALWTEYADISDDTLAKLSW